MKVGDLVRDPQVMQSKYAWATDRSAGMIIGDGSARHFEPPSYCDCYKEKFLVWWFKADIVYEQCECELEVINCEKSDS